MGDVTPRDELKGMDAKQIIGLLCLEKVQISHSAQNLEQLHLVVEELYYYLTTCKDTNKGSTKQE